MKTQGPSATDNKYCLGVDTSEPGAQMLAHAAGRVKRPRPSATLQEEETAMARPLLNQGRGNAQFQYSNLILHAERRKLEGDDVASELQGKVTWASRSGSLIAQVN